jgi:DNA-binding response OmpR family regulator
MVIMPRLRILVVEDDAAIREVLVDALEIEGFDVLQAGTFRDGLDTAVKVSCDLMLLDLVLPGGDGLQVLAQARLSRPTLPVIILTARGREEDRIAGLKLGADDYVVKPFSVKEVLARVEAVLRRSAERPAEGDDVAFSGGVAKLADNRVRFADGTDELLSEREIELLRYLAQNRGRTVSRDELLTRVWRLAPNRVRTRTVDMHIARLRDKLRDSADKPRIIVTVRGKGYRFESVESQP